MNSKSLKRIEDVIKHSGIWESIEIDHDVVYLDFKDVELGDPKINDLTISFRFAKDVFVALFYNNIWDIDFAANYNVDNPQLFDMFSHRIKEIKFIDFEYLSSVLEEDYKGFKLLSMDSECDVNNIRNDFFVVFKTSNIAVVVGGNELNFFNGNEKLNEDILKELSNRWVLYCLKYHLKINIIKDSMCEKYGY